MSVSTSSSRLVSVSRPASRGAVADGGRPAALGDHPYRPGVRASTAALTSPPSAHSPTVTRLAYSCLDRADSGSPARQATGRTAALPLGGERRRQPTEMEPEPATAPAQPG